LLADAGGGEIARDAGDAQPIGAVRGDFDIDHRIVEAERISERRADFEVRRQFENAVSVGIEFKLGAGAEHAVGDDAADGPRFERNAGAWNGRADRREGGDEAGARVRGAANDFELALRGFDLADLQLVGVRVLRRTDDARNRERCELLAGVLDGFDFETSHGHALDDIVDAGIGLQMLFEPGEREFHSTSPLSQKYGWAPKSRVRGPGPSNASGTNSA